LSKFIESSVKLALTQVGTASHWSPEILQSQKYSFSADGWSLGVVLYELMTFQLPFPNASAHQYLVAAVNQNPLPITLNHSSKLKSLILHMLVKDREF
jgi:NIMA (never in mitosis gene a)-related kinase